MKNAIFKNLFIFSAALALILCSCSKDAGKKQSSEKMLNSTDIKIGIILVGNESDNGYSYNHIVGLRKAAKELIIPYDNIIVKRNVPETDSVLSAFRELAKENVNIIFATSFGYEEYMMQIAAEYPNIEFAHCSGFRAAKSDLKNVHNYFPKIFEARYLSGIIAGLKAKEINNTKLGYVGAFDYAEVISGFTAFYLGAKKVYPDVEMEVIFTNRWNSKKLDRKAAEKLAASGVGVIGQHSNGYTPALVAEENGIFHVGYNTDMVPYAPKASLISVRIGWDVYYKYALSAIKNNEKIDKDWNKGYVDSAVYLSPINKAIATQGTNIDITMAENDLSNKGFHVFSGPLSGESASGRILDLKSGDFYDESGTQSSPSFDFLISGISVKYLEE